jgi:protein-disulfide isomerase
MRNPAIPTLLFGLLFFGFSAMACKPSRVASASAGSGGSRDPAPATSASHCKVLRDQLCSQFGAASDECRMAEEEIKRFTPDRCLGMLSRYAEIAKSASGFVEGRKALISPEQNTLHGPAPSIGLLGAPISMVMFADFDSPECSRGSAIASAIRNVYSDKVRLVFRQFPLSSNKDAHLAAEASLAAHAQGKFWPYYDVLFGNEHTHDRAALERYAKVAGLDLPALKKALDTHEFAADVDADKNLGKKVNVGALPALFVNGKRVSFPYGAVELSEVIEQALAAKP